MNFENKKKLIAILENFNQPSNDATPALIDFMFKEYDDAVVMKAALEVVKAKGRLSLGDIKQYLEPQTDSRTNATSLASRAYGLLRYPQNGGSSQASKHDPEAYAVLMSVGSWYDVHNRSEYDQKTLKYDLKAAAEQNIVTQKAQAIAQLAAPQTKNELPKAEAKEQTITLKSKEDWMF